MLIVAVIAVTLLFLLYTLSMWYKKKNSKTFLEFNACLNKYCELAVQTVKAYRDRIKGENEISDNVIKARNRIATSITAEERLEAEYQLKNAVELLFNAAQSISELESDSDFIELKNQIELLNSEMEALTKSLNIKLLNGEKYDLS